MLNPEPAYQDILQRVKTIPNITVLEVEDDNQVELIGNEVKPYVVLTLGGPVRAAQDRGIAESARDTTIMWVTFDCVSNRPVVARNLKTRILELLTDFIPEDSGRLTVDGSMRSSRKATSVLPFRVVESIGFSFRHNLQN